MSAARLEQPLAAVLGYLRFTGHPPEAIREIIATHAAEGLDSGEHLRFIAYVLQLPDASASDPTADAAIDDDGRVLSEVVIERHRQRELGYTRDHDDHHTLAELNAFIESRAVAVDHIDDLPVQRSLLVEIAAVAVAAVQSIDRRTAAT